MKQSKSTREDPCKSGFTFLNFTVSPRKLLLVLFDRRNDSDSELLEVRLPEMSLLLLLERMELQVRKLVKDLILVVLQPAERRARTV